MWAQKKTLKVVLTNTFTRSEPRKDCNDQGTKPVQKTLSDRLITMTPPTESQKREYLLKYYGTTNGKWVFDISKIQILAIFSLQDLRKQYYHFDEDLYMSIGKIELTWLGEGDEITNWESGYSLKVSFLLI